MNFKAAAKLAANAEVLQLFSHESVTCPEAMSAARLLPTIASILTELCEANDKNPSAVISKFHAARNPGISVLDYLRRVAQYADCSNTCFVLALIYIDRLQAHPNFQVCTLNVHRIIITSVMLAAKWFDDAYYNNAFYARIGGVSRNELNQLELEMLFMIGFTLTVTEREYLAYDTELRAHCRRLEERRAQSEHQQQLELQRQQHIAMMEQQALIQQQIAQQQAQQAHHVQAQYSEQFGPAGRPHFQQQQQQPQHHHHQQHEQQQHQHDHDGGLWQRSERPSQPVAVPTAHRGGDDFVNMVGNSSCSPSTSRHGSGSGVVVA